MAVTKNRRDGYLLIRDGLGNEEQVYFMNSDLTFNDPAENDPIAILNRPGHLDHIKKNDSFSTWGSVSFSLRYVDKDIRDYLIDPTTSTLTEDDKIPPERYKTVDLIFVLLDESEDEEEVHEMFNVWFNPGNVVFNEGDEVNTLNASGSILGKYDELAMHNRRFTGRTAAADFSTGVLWQYDDSDPELTRRWI